MKTPHYIELRVTHNSLKEEDIAEISSLAISDYSCCGVEEVFLDEDQLTRILGEKSYAGGKVPEKDLEFIEDHSYRKDFLHELKLYFLEEHQEQAQTFLHFIKSHYVDIQCSLMSVENKDWNNDWKKYYQPIVVSDFFEIIPAWDKETYKSQKKYPIYISPGMGFGTGGHESTVLCLKMLAFCTENLNFRGSKILDFGCGSGILGLGALKVLPTAKVDFCDIDEDSLINCQENILLNLLATSKNTAIIHSHDKYKLAEKYELIFANILLNILIEERDFILSKMNKGSYLILSGIIKNQVDELKEQYAVQGIKLEHELFLGDWACLLLRKEK